MARPTQFDRQNSFALYSAENPGEPHTGSDLDIEFNAVKVALDETQAALEQIQDADGRLARGSVGRAQLDASITLGFEAPAAWAADTSYEADISTVFHESKFYIALETHTSSDTFEADKWEEIADFTLQNTLNDGDVTSAKIADGAITTDKLDDVAVTTAKIADNAVNEDKILAGAVSTAKVADNAITVDKVASSVWSTGDVKLTLKSAADAGWVLFNDGTIGSASSGATTRANDDCEDLFLLLWTNFSNTLAPVTGGRGATAAADWAANKKIKLLTTLGRALGVAGAGSGLTSRTLGTIVGTETHTLVTAEMPSHTHTQNAHVHNITHRKRNDIPSSGGNTVVTEIGAGSEDNDTDSATATNQNTGGGGAHNNMQPTVFFNAMVKL